MKAVLLPVLITMCIMFAVDSVVISVSPYHEDMTFAMRWLACGSFAGLSSISARLVLRMLKVLP